MTAAVRTEWLKLRRSRPPWISRLAATIGTAVGGLFTYISLHPEQARDLGLLGDKAQLASLEPGWAGYFGLLAQIVAVGGSLIFGLTMLWTFGREFADRTAKDLLALPTGRGAIVTAKMATAAVWSLLLTGYIVVLGVGIGAGLGLTGWTTRTAIDGVVRIAVTAVLTIALTSTFGLAASLGRGYLAGVAALFAALFSAQVIAARVRGLVPVRGARPVRRYHRSGRWAARRRVHRRRGGRRRQPGRDHRLVAARRPPPVNHQRAGSRRARGPAVASDKAKAGLSMTRTNAARAAKSTGSMTCAVAVGRRGAQDLRLETGRWSALCIRAGRAR